MPMSKSGEHTSTPALHQWGVWLLLTIVFAGFAAGELYRNLYALIALFGIYLAVRHRKRLKEDRRWHWMLLLFGAIWVPMVLALPDAVDPGRAFRTTGRFLFYLFAAVTLLELLRNRRLATLLLYTFFAVMLIITLDGLWQAVTGRNILGYPFFRGVRVTSFFYPNPTMPLFLAVFSPLYFEVVRRLMSRWKVAWLLLIPFTVVIVLGASRTAWMLYLVSALLYALFCLRPLIRKVKWSGMVWKGGLIVLITGISMTQFELIEKRAEALTGLLSGDEKAANIAFSNRLPLWKTAITMAQHHWFNGVGPRNYTSAYPQHAPEDDPWLRQKVRQPHMTVLEIAAETGLIGLTGYLLFLLSVGYLLWQAARDEEERVAVPWGVCVLVAAFPLAASMPFYGFFWAQLVWFPLALFLALLSPRPRKCPTESRQAEGAVAE